MRRLLVLAAAVLLLAGCGNGSQARSDQPEAQPDVTEAEQRGLAVVATVFPLAWLAEQVAPDADVTLLAARGQDPHDLELGPDDRRLLDSADVVVYLGPIDFQPQVEQALDERTGAVVSLLDVAGEERLRGTADDDQGDAHDDEEHGEHDPHVWFDVAVMAEVVVAIGQALAGADPGGASGYGERAGALRDELLALDRAVDELLSGCRHDTAVVSHEAYAYLLAPRGLHQEGISGAGGHGGASPQRLAALVERIRAEDIPAVLAEPVEGRADAEALAREAGVELLEIHPLEVVSAAEHDTGYVELLRAQARTFARALDCG